MSIAILLSIKPQFANAIFAGDKHFEFRKAIPRDREAKRVYVYASAPISRVIGFFDVESILSDHPDALWAETQSGAGITKEYFHKYFAGRQLGHAFKVKDASLFDEPRCLASMFSIKHPPQSFRYVSAQLG